MQATIDFQELRRQERQRIRSAKNKKKNETNGRNEGSGCVDSSSTSCSRVGGDGNVGSDSQVGRTVMATAVDECSLSPYKTLLPQNHFSEDFHRIITPQMIDSVYYSRNFLSTDQSNEILSWLGSIPSMSCIGPHPIKPLTERYESMQHNGKWTRLKHARRKVALFDGTLPSCNLPPILQRLSNTLVSIGAFPKSHPPNHVLINEYQPGEGIMPHTDGPAYESRTATISLGGSDVIFKLWPRQQHPQQRGTPSNQGIEVQSTENKMLSSNSQISPVPSAKDRPSLEVILHGDGSLVVFTNDAYSNHCHAIAEGILEEITSAGGVCGNDVNGGTVVKRGHRFSLTFRCKK